ncbi:hypothetical protein CROQUDRAFT_725894 [Cronartium quercuum f. sp. fusiforme G11]|uniref:Uncharacterized protein n=1 Tax=Cronartium quercuum f. sp. fusiforme G11 TaxID=708437 RepID=A0A9P6NB17_9BASI|nr:hypothetical protein CROQUDRAFT_725894 [Cronartium quercuum f. sp. fusiforme G11]
MLFNSASILAFLACASFTLTIPLRVYIPGHHHQVSSPSQAIIDTAYSLFRTAADSVVFHQIEVGKILDKKGPAETDQVNQQLLDMYDQIYNMKNGLNRATGGVWSNLDPSSNLTILDCSTTFSDLLNSLKATCFRVLEMQSVDEALHNDFRNITNVTLEALEFSTNTLYVTNTTWMNILVNTTELGMLPDGFANIANFLGESLYLTM